MIRRSLQSAMSIRSTYLILFWYVAYTILLPFLSYTIPMAPKLSQPFSIPIPPPPRPFFFSTPQHSNTPTYKTPPIAIRMPVSRVGLVCPRTPGHENDGDVRWCKHVCGFPNPGTFSQGYHGWRNAITYRIEQDGIASFRHSMAAQRTALQA